MSESHDRAVADAEAFAEKKADCDDLDRRDYYIAGWHRRNIEVLRLRALSEVGRAHAETARDELLVAIAAMGEAMGKELGNAMAALHVRISVILDKYEPLRRDRTAMKEPNG